MTTFQHITQCDECKKEIVLKSKQDIFNDLDKIIYDLEFDLDDYDKLKEKHLFQIP